MRRPVLVVSRCWKKTVRWRWQEWCGVSGISVIGFNFLKVLTVRTLLSIEFDVVMKYE